MNHQVSKQMNRKDKKTLTGRFQMGIGRKHVGCEWTHQSGSARTILYLSEHVGGIVRHILKIILQFSHGNSTKKGQPIFVSIQIIYGIATDCEQPYDAVNRIVRLWRVSGCFKRRKTNEICAFTYDAAQFGFWKFSSTEMRGF
jgi:hypothetical protein